MAEWTDLAEYTRADMVGGQLIAYVEGDHVVLGHMVDGEFHLSLDGEEYARGMAAAADARKSRRKTKTVTVTADDGTTSDVTTVDEDLSIPEPPAEPVALASDLPVEPHAEPTLDELLG